MQDFTHTGLWSLVSFVHFPLRVKGMRVKIIGVLKTLLRDDKNQG